MKKYASRRVRHILGYLKISTCKDSLSILTFIKKYL